MPLTRAYRDGRLIAEGFPITAVSDHLADEHTTVWFDLCAPDPGELATIREELGLHELAVEDALSERQRPKLDHYEHHLFLAAHAVYLEPHGELAVAEVAAFITPQALVTVRKSERFDIAEVLQRWDGTAEVPADTLAYLLHGLLDYVVDTHFAVAQTLDDAIDELEDQLFSDAPTERDMQRRNYALRKSLARLRRVVLPMREVINTLLRRDLKIVGTDMAPYFQDVYDHVLRAEEWTDSLRDLVSNIFETSMTLRGNRLNVIMKQVTSWAAIIAVPTAVTGFYGQNVPYPGFGRVSGFWLSSAIILGLSGLLYLVFRKRDWL